MAQAPESDRTPSSEPLLPDINYWPNDVRIVSIQDARRRLTLADGLRPDIGKLRDEFVRLRREALLAAGMSDVRAMDDPQLVRSRLAQVSAPASWGNEWVGDLIYPGDIWDSPRQLQILGRVGAYAGVSPAEVRQVVETVASAMDAALNGCAHELLPRLQDVIEQLGAAWGDYQYLRDAIAGRLDRMENAEGLDDAGAVIARIRSSNRNFEDRPGRNGPETTNQERELGGVGGDATPPADHCQQDGTRGQSAPNRGGGDMTERSREAQSIPSAADSAATPIGEGARNDAIDLPQLSPTEALASRQFANALRQNPEWSDRHPDR